MLLVVGLRPLRLVRAGSRRGALVQNFAFRRACADGANEQRGTPQGEFKRVHPALSGGLRWCAKDEVSCRQRLNDSAHRFLVRSARSPNWLIHRVEQLKAESVLLARPLDHLARRQQHRSDPMRALHLRRLVDEQKTRLQHAPKLRPWLERAANLQPISQHNHRRILQRVEQFTGDAFLFLAIRFALCFVRLLACQLRIRRRLHKNEKSQTKEKRKGERHDILTLLSASALSILGLCSFHTEMPANANKSKVVSRYKSTSARWRKQKKKIDKRISAT